MGLEPGHPKSLNRSMVCVNVNLQIVTAYEHSYDKEPQPGVGFSMGGLESNFDMKDFREMRFQERGGPYS